MALLIILGTIGMHSGNNADCPQWCARHTGAWSSKCEWEACNRCSKCGESAVCAPLTSDIKVVCLSSAIPCTLADLAATTATTTIPGTASCKSWCPDRELSWTIKCTYPKCAGCQQCSEFFIFCRARPGAVSSRLSCDLDTLESISSIIAFLVIFLWSPR